MNETELISSINKVREKYGDRVYSHYEKNIPELDDLYYELITTLALNNPEKAKYYAAYYANSMSLATKIRINEFLLDHHCGIDLFNSYGIVLSNSDLKSDTSNLQDKVKELFQKMLAMSENSTFDLSNYYNEIWLYQLVDPLYLIKKDINNVKKITEDNRYSWLLYDDYLKDLFTYLIDKKYEFSINDTALVNYILEKPNYFDRFIRECSFNTEIFNKLLSHINEHQLSLDYIRILLERYPSYNSDIDITIDGNEEEFIKLISNIKVANVKFKIKTMTIDKDFLNQIKDILGDRVIVAPQRNANSGTIFYNIDELLEIDKKIDILAKSLSDDNGKSLSPLEKYISAYIIATNYGIYKEEDAIHHDASRSVYEIMKNSNNKAIVCVGYVSLLIELLARNGMEDVLVHHGVRAEGEGKTTDGYSNHDRLIIHIKDEKYDIDGVYMADPTWDSIKKDDIPGKKSFRYLLLTYDEALKDYEKFPNGVKDLYLDDWNLEKLSQKFGIDVKDYFHNKVDIDKIIRAICGINRFVSKSDERIPETSNIDSSYTKEEYNSVALQLGQYDKFIFDDHIKSFSFNEMIKYLRDEYNLDNSDIIVLLSTFIKNEFNNNMSLIVEDDKIKLYYEYNFWNEDGKLKYTEEDIERIYESVGRDISEFPFFKYMVKEVDMNEIINHFINSKSDLNINELNKIIEKEFNNIISNENMVK